MNFLYGFSDQDQGFHGFFISFFIRKGLFMFFYRILFSLSSCIQTRVKSHVASFLEMYISSFKALSLYLEIYQHQRLQKKDYMYT